VLNNLEWKSVNKIEMLIFTEVEQNDLIGATGYCHILAISHQPLNELVSELANSDGFKF
jgi:hypothetical protein